MLEVEFDLYIHQIVNEEKRVEYKNLKKEYIECIDKYKQKFINLDSKILGKKETKELYESTRMKNIPTQSFSSLLEYLQKSISLTSDIVKLIADIYGLMVNVLNEALLTISEFYSESKKLAMLLNISIINDMRFNHSSDMDKINTYKVDIYNSKLNKDKSKIKENIIRDNKSYELPYFFKYDDFLFLLY